MPCCPKPAGLEALPSLAGARIPHPVWATRQKQEFKKKKKKNTENNVLFNAAVLKIQVTCQVSKSSLTAALSITIH